MIDNTLADHRRVTLISAQWLITLRCEIEQPLPVCICGEQQAMGRWFTGQWIEWVTTGWVVCVMMERRTLTHQPRLANFSRAGKI